VRGTITATELLQWILLVLALLATTQLVDRVRLMRGIESKVDQIAENAQGLKGAESFFIHRIPNLEERFRTAKSIAINGITLSRTSDSFYGVFKQCASTGGQVRLIVVDPNHTALEVAASRFNKHQDPNRLRRETEHALDNFEALAADPNAARGFQLKLAPFVPPYGIWLIDANTPKAEIWVELYTFQDEPEPTIQLLPHRDGEWFHFFQRQFEIMWKSSRPWKPEPPVTERASVVQGETD
jgi:hypothetical protein